MKLDRTAKHSPIYGDSAAKWYQAGNYFDGQGELVSEEEAAGKAPLGEQPDVALVTDVRTMHGKEAAEAVRAAKVPPPEKPLAPEGDTHPSMDRQAELSLWNWRKLQGAVQAAGGKPFTGKGAKVKNVAWLLENTGP